jgi:DNA-binding CsgD family transcriptional regulator
MRIVNRESEKQMPEYADSRMPVQLETMPMDNRTCTAARASARDAMFDLILRDSNTVPMTTPEFLEAIASLTNSDLAGWSMIDSQSPTRTVHYFWPDHQLANRAEEVARANRVEHPLLRHYAKASTLEVLDPAEVAGPRQWRDTEAFGISYEIFGVTEQLGIPIRRRGRTLDTLVVARSRSRYDTPERDAAHWIQRTTQLAIATHTITPTGAQPNGTSAHALSVREREVLAIMATGVTRVAAAHVLGISSRTIDTHLDHIYRKLEVSGLMAAIRKVGLVTENLG